MHKVKNLNQSDNLLLFNGVGKIKWFSTNPHAAVKGNYIYVNFKAINSPNVTHHLPSNANIYIMGKKHLQIRIYIYIYIYMLSDEKMLL